MVGFSAYFFLHYTLHAGRKLISTNVNYITKLRNLSLENLHLNTDISSKWIYFIEWKNIPYSSPHDPFSILNTGSFRAHSIWKKGLTYMPCNRHGKYSFNSMHLHSFYLWKRRATCKAINFQNGQIHAKSILTVFFCDISLTYITNNVRQKHWYSTYLREKKTYMRCHKKFGLFCVCYKAYMLIGISI